MQEYRALAASATIHLPSGPQITGAVDRMLRFCREEFPYYDGLPRGDPDCIEPLDVLAAVAVNGFYGANASMIRSVHRGLAAGCDPLLLTIPVNSDLLTHDPSLGRVSALLHAAVQAPRVLIPVATKVLHRKRPALIPMLDNVVLAHYLRTSPTRLPGATQDKARAAGVAIDAMRLFRADLEAAQIEIASVVDALAGEGYAHSPVRVLEILLWTEIEERGYYRQASI
jgi:hypothetical protein